MSAQTGAHIFWSLVGPKTAFPGRILNKRTSSIIPHLYWSMIVYWIFRKRQNKVLTFKPLIHKLNKNRLFMSGNTANRRENIYWNIEIRCSNEKVTVTWTSRTVSRLAYENLIFLFLQFIENYQSWHIAKEFFRVLPKKWRSGGGKNFIWKSRFSGSKMSVVFFFWPQIRNLEQKRSFEKNCRFWLIFG